MEKLYDRADIYDLLENDSRYEIIKGHWQYLLEGKSVHSLNVPAIRLYASLGFRTVQGQNSLTAHWEIDR